MKHTMILLSYACCLLTASAAVPLRWTVDTTRAQPATFEAYQGETLKLEAALQSAGKPLEMSGIAALYWQTNGMGSAFWETTAAVNSNRLSAVWTPEMDVGARVYNCFIGVPGSIYHAAFQLRLRPSPGAEPNTLPLPVPVIDFAKVRVLNPPWGSGGGGVTPLEITNIAITVVNESVPEWAREEDPHFLHTDGGQMNGDLVIKDNTSLRFRTYDPSFDSKIYNGGAHTALCFDAISSFYFNTKDEHGDMYFNNKRIVTEENLSVNSQPFSNNVATIARTVTPPPYTPSATDPTFSNAVLAVQISTNDFAALYELKDAFSEIPVDPVTGGISIGGLLAALAAAVAWLKKNKVGSFNSVGGASATVDNSVAKLDNFFTNSNSLLTGTIDDRLPIPISEKSEGFTTESYKRFVVTVSGDMTVTLHTPTSGDAEIFECRFDGTSLAADASITFVGATATTMDVNCGTVTAGKVALMSAFWNGTTWDVNWKVEG